MKMKKILLLFLTSLLVMLTLWGNSQVFADDFDASASHAIAVETETGKILYEKDADTPAGIASITKILTIYMVYKQIDQGKLKWSDKVDISDYAYDLTANSDASNVPMEARSYTVEQLVDAAMISSANSAAIALAEKIGGSESHFVDMMKQQLKDWGITDATLVNASGLNNSYLGDHIYPGSQSSDENLMSAKDVAIIAQHLITEYPDILKITSQTTKDFDGTTQLNTYNEMLPGMSMARDGVDGLKTGTTELAGASFVATTTEDGMRIITVILHADNGDEDSNARFSATNSLMTYVYNTWQMTTALTKGERYKNSQARVIDGQAEYVPAIAKSRFRVVVRRGSTQDPTLTISTQKVTAPIKKGDKVGKATYKDSDLVGSGYLSQAPSVELSAKQNVNRSFFLKVWWNHFTEWVNTSL